jgi:hypothetical protein
MQLSYRPDIHIQIPAEVPDFFFSKMCKPAVGSTYPASYSLGAGTLSLGVKRLGCKANHLLLSSAKVQNKWSCTSSAPCMAFMVHEGTALALPYWGPCSVLSFGM